MKTGKLVVGICVMMALWSCTDENQHVDVEYVPINVVENRSTIIIGINNSGPETDWTKHPERFERFITGGALFKVG